MGNRSARFESPNRSIFAEMKEGHESFWTVPAGFVGEFVFESGPLKPK